MVTPRITRWSERDIANDGWGKLAFDPMKIHEYQAKAILAIRSPCARGEVAFTVDEAEAAAKKIGGSVVVKAQIHAGGRGKGGGVKVAKNARKRPRSPRKCWA